MSVLTGKKFLRIRQSFQMMYFLIWLAVGLLAGGTCKQGVANLLCITKAQGQQRACAITVMMFHVHFSVARTLFCAQVKPPLTWRMVSSSLSEHGIKGQFLTIVKCTWALRKLKKIPAGLLCFAMLYI